MNTKIKLMGVLLMLMVINTSFAQEENFSRIGTIDDKIFLDKYANYYLLSYTDISMDSEGEMKSIQLTAEEVTELYEELKSSFSNKNSKPSILNLQDVELRIYFKERSVKANYLEVIREDLKTENTSTLPWITLKELDQLFGSATK